MESIPFYIKQKIIEHETLVLIKLVEGLKEGARAWLPLSMLNCPAHGRWESGARSGPTEFQSTASLV